MHITEVKVFPIDEEKLRAFVSVVIDHCFMVNDIKIIQGRDGLFISMPSRRKKNGDFKDIAHPLNNDTRRSLEDQILLEYSNVTGRAVERRLPRAELEAAQVAAVPPPECKADVPVPKAPGVGMSTIGKPQSSALDEIQERHLSESFWTVR
jgi:stage V sporulation protein G